MIGKKFLAQPTNVTMWPTVIPLVLLTRLGFIQNTEVLLVKSFLVLGKTVNRPLHTTLIYWNTWESILILYWSVFSVRIELIEILKWKAIIARISKCLISSAKTVTEFLSVESTWIITLLLNIRTKITRVTFARLTLALDHTFRIISSTVISFWPNGMKIPKLSIRFLES